MNLKGSHFISRLESSSYNAWKLGVEMLFIRGRLLSIVGERRLPPGGAGNPISNRRKTPNVLQQLFPSTLEKCVQDIRNAIVVCKELKGVREMRGFSNCFYL